MLVTRLGGHLSGNVSKTTSFVIAGQGGGNKLEKAKMLDVEIIDEEEFVSRYSEWLD